MPKPEKLPKKQGEYFLARHYIEILKAIVLRSIRNARGRLRWDKGNDDEYFAEEIAREIYNEWAKRNMEEKKICNYCGRKPVALIRVENKMVDVCKHHLKEYRDQLKNLYKNMESDENAS